MTQSDPRASRATGLARKIIAATAEEENSSVVLVAMAQAIAATLAATGDLQRPGGIEKAVLAVDYALRAIAVRERVSQ
jgi:hypothetical protein